VCERAAQDVAARVVLLRGAGPAFIAGGDVAFFKTNVAQIPRQVIVFGAELYRGVLALRRAPKPVIACVHGAVAGAGMSIMMACDLIIAAEGTQFTMAYSRIATSPDGGASWFLPRLVGYHKAMEMLLLADTVDAAALHAMGIVNRVVAAAELAAAAQQLAKRLAGGPATAYAETKALVNDELNQVLMKHLQAEVEAFSRCSAHADFAEGVTAFVEKRKARFDGSVEC
jgi:2-(1,2-epoxy-1,2-dihydrophenyl)acetyl-CoA isomerase